MVITDRLEIMAVKQVIDIDGSTELIAKLIGDAGIRNGIATLLASVVAEAGRSTLQIQSRAHAPFMPLPWQTVIGPDSCHMTWHTRIGGNIVTHRRDIIAPVTCLGVGIRGSHLQATQDFTVDFRLKTLTTNLRRGPVARTAAIQVGYALRHRTILEIHALL